MSKARKSARRRTIALTASVALRASAALLMSIWAAAAQAQMSPPDTWTVLTIDAKGDGRDPSLADAAQLSYGYDKQRDMLWFRVGVYGNLHQSAIGINVAVDTGLLSKMNWWGANAQFSFDKLLTAWVTRTNSGYEGTIGLADMTGVQAKRFNNLASKTVQVWVRGNAIVLGVKRSELTDKMKFDVIASVGSNEQWNDDVPNVRSIPIDLSGSPPQSIMEIDLRINNFLLPATYRALPPHKSPHSEERKRSPAPCASARCVFKEPYV